MKVAITIKTNLTFDGRVVAQLNTLAVTYPEYKFKLFVLEDGKFKGSLPKNITYKKINLLMRFLPKVKSLQFIKLIEYGVNIFFQFLFYKPDIIHVHDAASILGPIFYKKIVKNNFLIYDDHELMYMDGQLAFYEKVMKRLEGTMFLLADHIIMANNERYDYAKQHIGILKDKAVTVIENYHFIESSKKNKNHILLQKDRDNKYLLHQGVINKDRGQSLLFEILEVLPDDWKLVMIGIRAEAYHKLFDENLYLKDKTIFGGQIPYEFLNEYWAEVDAAVIFYQVDKVNNRLCAPNRLYQAANIGIPIIVNENPILKKFVEKHANGISLRKEDSSLASYFFSNFSQIQSKAQSLKGKFSYHMQGKKLIALYNDITLRKLTY